MVLSLEIAYVRMELKVAFERVVDGSTTAHFWAPAGHCKQFFEGKENRAKHNRLQLYTSLGAW